MSTTLEPNLTDSVPAGEGDVSEPIMGLVRLMREGARGSKGVLMDIVNIQIYTETGIILTSKTLVSVVDQTKT